MTTELVTKERAQEPWRVVLDDGAVLDAPVTVYAGDDIEARIAWRGRLYRAPGRTSRHAVWCAAARMVLDHSDRSDEPMMVVEVLAPGELARTVVAQADELARLREKLDELAGEVDAQRHLARVADAAVVSLRAIVEGRTVPPTDEEIAAHQRVGGRWTVSHNHDGRRLTYTLDATADDARAEARYAGPNKRRWWPLDADGRPCAWPTTGGA